MINNPDIEKFFTQAQQSASQMVKGIQQNIKLRWHTKILDAVEDIEEFLNDGKQVQQVQFFSHEGKIILVYAAI